MKVKYLGPVVTVVPTAGGVQVAPGGEPEVTEAQAKILLMVPALWEPADAEAKTVVPEWPAAISMDTGGLDPFSPEAVCTGGIVREEAGVHYRAKHASHGETPRLAAHVWEQLANVVQPGLPGIVAPIASLGSPQGLGGFESETNVAVFARAIVPKTGRLKDLIYKEGLLGTATKVAGAVYDTGQATASMYTRLGESGAVTRTLEPGWFSVGECGAPHVVAGQHVLLGLVSDGAGRLSTGTFFGGRPLPEGWLPGRVEGKINSRCNIGGLAFPATLAEAALEWEEAPVAHLLGRIE